MQRLIVGSTAMRHHLAGCREPKDLDVLSPDRGDADEAFWHDQFASWIPPGCDRIAGLDELYTLKVSHSYWDLGGGSWEKHIGDAAALKAAGARLDLELHRMLYGVWEGKHGRKRVDLSMEADDFFDDAVHRIYDHDSIHSSVAYGTAPMYEAVLRDGRSVAVDMDKVRALSFEDRLKLYREEIYATALERKVIPSGYRCSPRAAYAFALKRTITSLTKGWSARFLVENYDTLQAPDIDYVARHRSNSHKLIRLDG